MKRSNATVARLCGVDVVGFAFAGPLLLLTTHYLHWCCNNISTAGCWCLLQFEHNNGDNDEQV